MLKRTNTSEVGHPDRPPLLPERTGIGLLAEAVDNRRERRVRFVDQPLLIDSRLPLGDRGARGLNPVEEVMVLNTLVAAARESYRAALGGHPSD